MKKISLVLLLASWLFALSGVALDINSGEIDALFELGGHRRDEERVRRLSDWIGKGTDAKIRLDFLKNEWNNDSLCPFMSFEDALKEVTKDNSKMVFYISTTQPGFISLVAMKTGRSKPGRIVFELKGDGIWTKIYGINNKYIDGHSLNKLVDRLKENGQFSHQHEPKRYIP